MSNLTTAESNAIVSIEEHAKEIENLAKAYAEYIAAGNEPKPIEQLAIAQAIYKSVAEEVSTNNPNSIRYIADSEMLKAYELGGIKSRDMRVNGQKVGTYTVRVNKAFSKDRPVLTDISAFKAWLDDNHDYAIAYALSQADFAAWVIAQGELPDGYEIERVEFPEAATGTTLKVDVQKVADAMGNELPNAVAGLIGGGK